MNYITAIPVLIQEDCEELTTANTAFLLDEEELTEEMLCELKYNEKYASFEGHSVIVDKNSGVVLHGRFKGKRVNLVKNRQRQMRDIYKHSDQMADQKKAKIASTLSSIQKPRLQANKQHDADSDKFFAYRKSKVDEIKNKDHRLSSATALKRVQKDPEDQRLRDKWSKSLMKSANLNRKNYVLKDKYKTLDKNKNKEVLRRVKKEVI